MNDHSQAFADRPDLLTGSETGRTLVVANPISGTFHRRRLEKMIAQLRAKGVAVDLHLTSRAGELRTLAETLPEDVTTLVVAGGDGSLNEAVNGLVRRSGSPPALAVLPFGTANVLARELKLPFHASPIARMLRRRRLAPLHLGQIGDRAFLLMASAGFDGAVVHAVDPALKQRYGALAYAFAALRLAMARKGRDVLVDADGERIVCRIAVATTARCYGGPMSITTKTGVTMPGLRLVTLADDRPLTLLKAAVMLGLGRLDRLASVGDRPMTEVRMSGQGIAMQIDGDAMDTTDAPIRAHPRLLSVVVP
ncbi:Diacylglycerol kinase [Hartmannibacter diazotrophicus]|uniref:Diacylglycerol kinase n=1 Tax=Hartmannibacter diazotrophicus TaxID=1482074 RepID=A0A2C9D3F7_9HYPH|nr:diacylglycerol kinase family protein [Hartmannibacter diazotrophicus]SON54800.1 Diacylglycerol kinase [Hartmannibacter diazotrophicus]